MRSFVMAAAIVVFSAAVHAQRVDDLARRFSEAFGNRTLATLDRGRVFKGRVSLTIEHSLSGRRSTRSFPNFRSMEAWFRSRDRDGVPGRHSRELERCRAGICTFEPQSILHNNLYMKRLSYGFVKGKPYIKSVLILDGD